MTKLKKKATKSSTTGSIRIIAGTHRGRKLPVLMADGLRPTTDRVKETVFNWLMPYIPDALCLDCFAGSGGLGFEAASRGAANVTMLELNKAAANQLTRNSQLLKASNVDIVQTNALAFLQQSPTPVDLVFLDPPFRQQLVEQAANLLEQGWLNDQALIYIEMESDNTQPKQSVPANWQLLKEKIAGQVCYQLYQRR